MKNGITLIFTFLLVGNLNAQKIDKKIPNWYNGNKYGIVTDKAYAKLC